MCTKHQLILSPLDLLILTCELSAPQLPSTPGTKTSLRDQKKATLVLCVGTRELTLVAYNVDMSSVHCMYMSSNLVRKL